ADNQLQIGELEGCEHAIEVLSLHKEPKVQAFGCALLQSVACNNPEMRTRIGEIGGVEAIVQAMQANPKAANVLAFGASALQSLATSNQDNVRRCHKLKVVDLVADAMEAHPFSVKLREFGEMLTNTIEG
ncbi:Protein aardvark (Suppressor of amiB protein 16), partial [Durusdinium trenchii]